jgi:hypothetical protein
VNAQGVAEAGIDHGGLMKELLEATVAAGCQPEYGLFAAAEGSNLMYPNPAAEAIPQGLALLEFLGALRQHLTHLSLSTILKCTHSCGLSKHCAHCSCRLHVSVLPSECWWSGVLSAVAPAGLMVGKALYEGILLNMSLAPCFLLSLQVRAVCC